MGRAWKIALALLAVLGAVLVVNAVVTDRQTKPARPGGDSEVVDLPGSDDLRVSDEGPNGGHTIVLIHGFAASMNWWDRVVPLLSAGNRVVRVDLLGHGGSAKPRKGYEMQNQAKLVLAALDKLGIKRALVVGHSMGGLVATSMVEQRPRLVEGMVTLGTPPTKDAGQLPFVARLAFVPVIGEAIKRTATDGLIKDGLESAFTSDTQVPQQFVEDFRAMTYRSYDSSHEQADDYTGAEPLDDRLNDTKVKLLAIQGSEDQLVEPASVNEFKRVPGARVVTMNGVGHSPMWERPRETAHLILHFQRSIEQRNQPS